MKNIVHEQIDLHEIMSTKCLVTDKKERKSELKLMYVICVIKELFLLILFFFAVSFVYVDRSFLFTQLLELGRRKTKRRKEERMNEKEKRVFVTLI